jgi:hypothetical protein
MNKNENKKTKNIEIKNTNEDQTEGLSKNRK